MFTIEVKDEELVSALRTLRGRLSAPSMRSVMREVADAVRNSIVRSFESMSSPDGRPWAPLALSTRLQRLRKYKGRHFRNGRGTGIGALNAYGRAALNGRFEILRNTSNLMNSIGDSAKGGYLHITADEVVVGTKLPYAAIHNFGGQAGRGRKVRIPARPFMGVSAEGRAEIMDIIRRHLEAA